MNDARPKGVGTVRDLAAYDPETAVTTIANHIVYDAFGRVTAQTDPTVTTLFGFTARPFDSATGLQNNLNRWYDAETGTWISVDLIGFAAADANVYRYARNLPGSCVDPDGLRGRRPGELIPGYKPNPYYDPYGHAWSPIPASEPDYGTQEWDDKWGVNFNPQKVHDYYVALYATRMSRWEMAQKNGVKSPRPVAPQMEIRLPLPGEFDRLDPSWWDYGWEVFWGMVNAGANETASAVGGGAQAIAETLSHMEQYTRNQMNKYDTPGYEKQYEYWKERYERIRALKAEAAKKRQQEE